MASSGRDSVPQRFWFCWGDPKPGRESRCDPSSAKPRGRATAPDPLPAQLRTEPARSCASSPQGHVLFHGQLPRHQGLRVLSRTALPCERAPSLPTLRHGVIPTQRQGYECLFAGQGTRSSSLSLWLQAFLWQKAKRLPRQSLLLEDPFFPVTSSSFARTRLQKGFPQNLPGTEGRLTRLQSPRFSFLKMNTAFPFSSYQESPQSPQCFKDD